jgi:hypothetical protein
LKGLKATTAVLAAMLVAALGSTAALAWNGSIEASYNCVKQKVYVTAHDGSDGAFRHAGSGTLVFEKGTTRFTAPWHFDQSGPDDQVIAPVDFHGKATGTWTVKLHEDYSVKTTFEVTTCITSSPLGTPTNITASPTMHASPTSATTPTEAASPTSAVSASALPSPPVTGSGAGGDGGFGAVLAALGLVILAGGGLTLFFSRRSSSTTS